jgi:RHS repeat-associated protein
VFNRFRLDLSTSRSTLTIKVYYNGAYKFTATDGSPFAAGPVGMIGGYNLMYWDNVVAMTNVSPATVVSYDDFDAWGMVLEGRSGNSADGRQRFKFTGKERDTESKYDYFGARYYDARVRRWMSVDPLSSKALGLSPYRYGFNNPINNFDPDGRFELDKSDSKKFPRLNLYLKHLTGDWSNKTENFKAQFSEKSGLSEKQTVQILTSGKGPLVRIADLDSPTKKLNGETYGVDIGGGRFSNANAGKGLIKIDNDVVARFESAKTETEVGSAKLLLESTLFHEGTHFGNLKTSKSFNGSFGESGKEFEKGAYGVDIGRANASQIYGSSLEVQRMDPLPVRTVHSEP